MKTRVPVASHSFLSFCLFTDCFANSIVPSCIFGTAVARSPKTQIPFQAISNQEKQTQQTHIIEHLVGNSLLLRMHLGGYLIFKQNHIAKSTRLKIVLCQPMIGCFLVCYPGIFGIWPLPKQSNPENSQQVRAGESNPHVENHIHSQYVGNISSCRGLAISFYLDIQKTPFMVKPCHTKDVRISSTNVIYGDGSKPSTTYILTIFGAINTH